MPPKFGLPSPADWEAACSKRYATAVRSPTLYSPPAGSGAERFRTEPVSATELLQAVNYLVGQAEVSRQSAGQLAGEIVEAWITGNGLVDLENPAEAFRAVTAEDVLRVAQRNLDPALRAEGVVRGGGPKEPAGG